MTLALQVSGVILVVYLLSRCISAINDASDEIDRILADKRVDQHDDEVIQQLVERPTDAEQAKAAGERLQRAIDQGRLARERLEFSAILRASGYTEAEL